jgi:hypothetical protein
MSKCRDRNCTGCVVFHVDGAVVIITHRNFRHNHPLNDIHIKGVAMLSQQEQAEIRYLRLAG